MAAKGLSGLGKVTLANRERQVLMEPRGIGLLMSTLRSADEVRTAEFSTSDASAIDPELLVIAETIIDRAKGKFDPADFHDSYQEALRELVENKLKGITTIPRTIAEPPKVIDLMEALKRSLMEKGALPTAAKAKRTRRLRDGTLRSGRLLWNYPTSPTPLSRFYDIRLEFQQGGVPKVFVITPDLVTLAEGRRLPHVYDQNPPRLCLYLPRASEWEAWMRLDQTIVPWTSLWLFYFEEWLISNDWKGGGEYPRLAKKKSRSRHRARDASALEASIAACVSPE